MKPFQYEQAVSVNDAVTSVAGRSGAVYLAASLAAFTWLVRNR